MAGCRLDSLSDESLLAGMAAGDEWAGPVFVRRHQQRLFGMAISVVGEATLAEDVAQEAIIRIFRHAAVFDVRRGSVAAWTSTITRNLAIDARRRRTAIPTDPGDPIFAGMSGSAPEPEQTALDRDALRRVRTALTQLPSEQRRAVLLAAMYGRSASEIAQAEAIPLGTAKSRVRLGMNRLRDVLAESDEAGHDEPVASRGGRLRDS